MSWIWTLFVGAVIGAIATGLVDKRKIQKDVSLISLQAFLALH